MTNLDPEARLVASILTDDLIHEAYETFCPTYLESAEYQPVLRAAYQCYEMSGQRCPSIEDIRYYLAEQDRALLDNRISPALARVEEARGSLSDATVELQRQKMRDQVSCIGFRLLMTSQTVRDAVEAHDRATLEKSLDSHSHRITSARARLPSLDFWAARNYVPKPDRWVMSRLLKRENITLLYGSGGVGKTWFVLALMARLARGVAYGPFAPPSARPAGALYVNLEDAVDDLAERIAPLAESLYEEGRVAPVEVLTPTRLVARSEWEAIRRRAKRIDNLGVIIIDNLQAMLTSDKDENSTTAASDIFENLNDIARDCDCAVLLLHHTNKEATKTSTEHSITAANGSRAVTNHVRHAVSMVRLSQEGLSELGLDGPHVELRIPKSNVVCQSV